MWQAPFDGADLLLLMFRSIFPGRPPHLEAWVGDQWKRAHQFRLYFHEEGHTVLRATAESLMGNVVLQKLDDDHAYAPISDIEARIKNEEIAVIKCIPYNVGYPVEDDHDLEEDEELDVTFGADPRDYQ